MTEMDHVLQSVESSMSCPEFKARLLAMLGRLGLYRVPRANLIHYRTEVAVKLLADADRPETRDALQSRFGISRRSAYRIISRALDMRQGRLFD